MNLKKISERIYIWGVAIGGLYLLFRNIPHILDPKTFLDLFFLAILVVISENSPVPIPKGNATLSVSMPVACAVTTLYGLEIGMWMLALASLRKKDLRREVPLDTVLFNRAMLAISMYLFGMSYQLFGGVFGTFTFPSSLPGFFVGSCLYTLANMGFATVGLSLQTDLSLLSVVRVNMKWSLPSILILFPVGAAMVLVVQQGGVLLLMALYIPLMASKISMQKYLDLKDAYQEMAVALSEAIDARDSYTKGHSERVAAYAASIAQEMGMTEDKVDLIRYVGILHDVGKVGIPDAIMNKPGRFTAEEYEIMKRHSAMGADMVKGMSFLGKGREWILYHHERWDGKGFPEGLKGNEIPLEARILACADAFDAMTTDRPYKKRMSFEDAKTELIKCSGTQFDPQVVQAKLSVMGKHPQRYTRD